MKTGTVVIGRNEGAKLIACLQSIKIDRYPVVYVDSGSSDDSVQQAKNLGTEVIALDMSSPFTAARARNAGLGRLNELRGGLQYVQFVDGDCVMVDGWFVAAEAFLDGMMMWPLCVDVCGKFSPAPRSITSFVILSGTRLWERPGNVAASP